MRKFLSVLVALSLVMSLFSGLVAAPKSVSAAAPLTEVTIVTPGSGASFTPGREFYVNAVVSNPDRDAGIPDATATLTIEGNAVLVDGETATKSIDLPACGVADVWWKVECTDPGDVTLTVTSGAGSDAVTVTQIGQSVDGGHDVHVTWIETPCDLPFNGMVPVGTLFTVKALATYEGSSWAEASSMTVKYDPAAVELLSAETVPLGDLYGSRPEEAMWNFRCIAAGETTITVEFNSIDVDPSAVFVEKPCKFWQDPKPGDDPGDPPDEYWHLHLEAPEKVCTNCAQNAFTVSAIAENHTLSAEDVYATLVIENPLLAAFQTGETAGKPGVSIPADGDASWTWGVICLNPGPTSFRVDLRNTLTGDVFKHEHIIVQQKDYLVLLGDVNELIDPNDPASIDPDTMVYADPAANPAEWVYFNPATLNATTEVCDTFTVKTTFENCTCAPVGTPGVSHVFAKVNLPSTVDLTGMVTVEEWVRVSDGEGHPYHDSEMKGSYQIPAQAVIDNGYILPLQTTCACCYFVITWKLECTGSDNGRYKDVGFQAFLSTDTVNPLDETHFHLMQQSAPHIQTGIDFLPGWYDDTLGTTPIGVIAAPCSEQDALIDANKFTVVIPVSNTGDVDALNVYLRAELTGDYANAEYAVLHDGDFETNWISFSSIQQIGLGTMEGHDAKKILIRAQCDGPEDVVAHIDAVTGYDALKGDAFRIDATNGGKENTEDSCGDQYVCFAEDKTLIQIPMKFTIVEPTAEEGATGKLVSSNYAVKILVENCSTVEEEILNGLNATLHIHGDAEFNPETGETATHALGTIGMGGHAETAWNVHCNGVGSATFDVVLTGTAPLLEMERSVTVNQLPATEVHVEVVSPLSNGNVLYATGQKFAVSVRVWNDGSIPAENVHLELNSDEDMAGIHGVKVVDVHGPKDPQEYEHYELGTLAPGEQVFVTWTVQVLRPTRPNLAGDDCIDIEGEGTNINDFDTALHVWLYPAAHLIVALDPIPDIPENTDFTVTGTVTNIGGADATDVILNLGVLYGDIAPAVGSAFTKYIGTVPAMRDNILTPVPFSWELQCEKAGKTSITITPEGKDEYGFSSMVFALGADLDETWLDEFGHFWREWHEVTPLAPIPPFCIEAAAATFKQIDVTAPLVAIYTPNGTTQASTTYTIGYGSAAADVAKYEVKLNDGLWIDNQLNTTYTFTGLAVGVNTLYVRATDLSGNVGPEVSILVIVDLTLPTVTIDPIAGLTSLNYGTITYGAAGGTPPYAFSFKVNNGGWNDLANATSYMYTGLVEGMNVLSVKATDSLGKAGIAFAYVTLDTTAPTGTVIINGGAAKTNSTAVVLAVEAYDLHMPLEYSTDGLVWSFVAPTAATLSGADGAKTVKVWFKDVVGNIGSAVGTIILDTVAPDVAISSDSVTQESTTFTMSYGSAAADVAKYEVKLNAGSWMNNQLNTSYTFYALPLGANTLSVRALDDAGNIGAADSIVITVVDLTAPVAPFANPIGGFYTAPQVVVLNDAEAGVTIYYTLDGTLPTMSSTVYTAPINIGAGTTVLKAIAADASHNVSDVMTAIYVVNPVTVVSATLNMINGYNLISVPFSASINVLGTNVTEVYEWTGVLWNPVTTLNPGIGYLVNHTGVETITASGTATSSPYMTSAIGNWQLIGNPFEVAVPWASVTGSIAEKYAWNGSIWASSTGSMQPGIGYLVRTTSVGSLTFARP